MTTFRPLLFALVATATACVVPAPEGFGDGTDGEDGTDGSSDTDDAVDTDVAASGLTALVLDDGGSLDQVADALEEAGHAVIEGPMFDTWDGTNPGLDGVDVVVFLQGAIDEDLLLPPEGDAALLGFVTSGGGLIRTEKAAFFADSGNNMAVDDGLPVSYDQGFQTGANWESLERDHPLLTDLPNAWNDDAAYAVVEPMDEAPVEVVMDSNPGGVPMVSYRDDLGGRVIHLNHDMTGTTEQLSTGIRGLLGNAVTFAAP